MSKRQPYPFAEPSADGSQSQYWRSLEERARYADAEGEAAHKKDRAREFPAGHFETPASEESFEVSRRGVLGFAAAALALVGAEGCRRPVEKIIPYGKMPEYVVPGNATHYATVYPRRGDVIGLLVESHEGRPTKVEGNPNHPGSMSAADMHAQASILDLYDMDRSKCIAKDGKAPEKGCEDKHVQEFQAAFDGALAKHAGDQGAKLRILMEPITSPSAVRLRAAILAKFPKATVHTYTAAHDSNAREGAKLAFGKPMQAVYGFNARAILSLDCDFLQTESGNLYANKFFAGGRRVGAPTFRMSRLYVVEPALTTTGANADHRLRLPAADVFRYLVALTAHIATEHAAKVPLGPIGEAAKKLAKAEGISEKWIKSVARDLVNGPGLVVVGSRQPPIVHALAHALNGAMSNFFNTILVPTTDPDEKHAGAEIKALAEAMQGGQVETLVIVGGNPVYDAPADLKFGDALAKVPFSVHLSSHVDETSAKAKWHVPRAHTYEAWGDHRSLDGTVAVQQPLIAPLFNSTSDLELLAQIAKTPELKGYDIVRTTMRTAGRAGAECKVLENGVQECKDANGNPVRLDTDFEKNWKRALHEGVASVGALRGGPRPKTAIEEGNVAAELGKAKLAASPTKDSLEVVFLVDNKMLDGRYANNSWLQELPDPVTKIVWDNAALMSPKTAKELGVASGDMIQVTVENRSISIGAWVLPGFADYSIALPLGWGRTMAGQIGNGRGFNVYPLRSTTAMEFAGGAKVQKAGDKYIFGQTQEHNSMEGRPLARETTLEGFKHEPNFAELQSPPQRALPLWKPQDYSQGYQWGMTIDLNLCTGCNACTIACQSENNVPVVGKVEVSRGREMHWIRIDRYFVENRELGSTADDPMVAHQPLMCVHCEEAPCENVCPVNATTHSPEGLNEMVYNRCIGTRYCANNCPYKVRRFNYLNWHNDSVWKNEGGLPETLQMQQNPNVSVRFRGVMEKCTYCVQRIQSAKINAKRNNRTVRDGEIKTACQQTCPADAITFGDLNDQNSRVARLARDERRYSLLGELGTKPRTTYLGKVRNPNPEMA